MAERRAGGWRFDVAVLVGAWAFIFLLHPLPSIHWFDYSWIAYNLVPLPFSVTGMLDAIRWQATEHGSAYMTRPARAVTWWLAGKAFGYSPVGYYVANGLALGIAVWASTRLAMTLTGSRARALVVGLGVAVTYATVFPLLFIGYAQPAACAFLGLAAWFHAETRDGGRWWLRSLAVLLVLVAALSHETYLAYALVPLLHAVVVRRDRRVAVRALAFVAILPVYVVTRDLQARVYGGAPSWLTTILTNVRESSSQLVENPGRVLFTTLSGGLALDPLRALPVLPEFARLRQLALSLPGVLTLALVTAPTIGLAVLAVAVARQDDASRRRAIFYALWLVVAIAPLMLPLGTSEAMHQIGALPALFLLWTETFSSRASRTTLVAASMLLAAWTGVHLWARWALFHRDLPAMARAVHALHRVLAEAQASGSFAVVALFPVQIGAQYGMLPQVAPLYPGATDGRWLRGDRSRGCLLEPVWIWSTFRPPKLPGACHIGDALRLGPIAAAVAHELEGSSQMLGHSTTTLTKEARPQLLRICPLLTAADQMIGGARYRLDRVDVGGDVRWYRFSLEGEPALQPIAACDAPR